MRIVLTAIAIILIPVMVSGFDSAPVIIAWESGLKPPYLMLDNNQSPVGIAVDILSEILKRKNIKARHIVMPWKRCLKYIQQQKVDIVPNASFKKDRAEYAFYSNPLYETHLVLYYLKSKFQAPPDIKTVRDLKPYRVGGILGFNYKQYEGVLTVHTGAKSRIALIKMLNAERVDFAVLQKEIMLARQKKGDVDLSGLAYIPDPGRPINVSHILTVKNSKGELLKSIIDAGIIELTNDGTIQKINKVYLGE